MHPCRAAALAALVVASVIAPARSAPCNSTATCPTSPCTYAVPPQAALSIPPCTFPSQPLRLAVTACNYVDACNITAVAAAGVDAILIDLNWAPFDVRPNVSAPPAWNDAAWAPVEAHISAAVAAGLRVLIGPGAHVPPQYIWDAGARFVNAGGAAYAPDSDAWPNLVFYTELRVYAEQYMAWLGQRLANATAGGHIAALRLGGGHYGELSYPRGGPPGGVYWAFDERAAALNPVPHWRPGAPAPNNEALAFLTWYLGSLAGYQNWQAATAAAAFPGVPLAMLYPGAEADFSDVGAAVAAGLPQTLWDTVTAGQVRSLLAPSLARTSPQGMVWCTSVSGGGSQANLAPMMAVASAVGLPRGGENVGGVDAPGDALVSVGMARRAELATLMWLPPHTPDDPGNLTAQLPLLSALGRAAAVPATLCSGGSSGGGYAAALRAAAPSLPPPFAATVAAPSLGSYLRLGDDGGLALFATNVSDVPGLRGAVLWQVGPFEALLQAQHQLQHQHQHELHADQQSDAPVQGRVQRSGSGGAAPPFSLVVNASANALQLLRAADGSIVWQCAGPAAAACAGLQRPAALQQQQRGGSNAAGGGGGCSGADAGGGTTGGGGGGGSSGGLFLTLTDAASLRLYNGVPSAPGSFVDVTTC